MYYNFQPMIERMINYLYDEYGIIATLENAYSYATIHHDETTSEWYMTRQDLQDVLDDLNIDAPLDFFIYGE